MSGSLTDGIFLKREERDLYEQAIQREGKIWKKSNRVIVGFQKRYFKVISRGGYLAYYDKKPTIKQQDVKPNGVFEIAKMTAIEIKKPRYFNFEYNDRIFEMYTKTKEEADMWVVCLKFLAEQKSKEQETATSTRSASYFHTLTNTLVLKEEGTGRNSGSLEREPRPRKQTTKGKGHKFSNIDAKAFCSVIQENPTIVVDKDQQSLSEKALKAKGIWNYLKDVKKSAISSRILYGFLKKRSKGKIKYFNSRWFFMISSRPLNQEDFLNDSEVLSESVLPPLLDFDVIYYYIMEDPDDASGSLGEIRTVNILKVEVKNMDKSSEEGHAFIIDTGKKLYHLNTPHRFDLERWVEAIEISMQTSRERQLSITGACKNISQTVTLFDTNEDILRQQLEDKYDSVIPKDKDDWEDVDSLLQVCTLLRDDMITTFDACLALKPPRTDIIELYMKVAHSHMSEVLAQYWDLKAIELNPYDTVSLVDWTFNYYKSLKKFGVNDDSVENGYLQLCNAYARKIHTQITPLVINILQSEKEGAQIEQDNAGYLYTNAPYDLVKIFSESFQVVIAKKVKDLILKVLKVFQVITQQYQRALQRLLESDSKLQHDFMIAQCNNCFIFFELMEDLISPIREQELATDDEIESHFSQRSIQQHFTRIQTQLLTQMTTSIFKLRLEPMYQKNFLDLDMEAILNESFKYFEDYASKMSKSTARQAWTAFLERTVLCYIQCMLNSSNKIRQKSSEHTIVKIKEDYEKIEYRFSEFMTARSMKGGIEVLDDLVSFFEASPAFISVACEKLRKTHGPTFKLTTVKAILNLRTDMTKEERIMALQVCGEILASFKNGEFNNPLKKGIFSSLDTTQAETIKDVDDINDKIVMDHQDEDDDGFDMNIDDFLKEGGINVDDYDEHDLKGAQDKDDYDDKKKEEEFNTDPDIQMRGYLFKSSMKVEGNADGGDLLGMVFNGIGTGMKIGLKIFTEAMFIKQKKLFFAIKNGILYWYGHERAREASNQIVIKNTKAIEQDQKNPKEFYIVYKQKCYRLASENDQMALKWVNSLRMVKQNDEDQLDEHRYEKQKIFHKITGKSMYKDYEVLLEQYEDKVHTTIENKLNEYLKYKYKGKVETSAKQALKKPNKKEPQVDSKVINEEENFIKQLPETADLMTKINPSQIDLFQAAFGGEDAAHAQVIRKKLQQKAIKKAKQAEKERNNSGNSKEDDCSPFWRNKKEESKSPDRTPAVSKEQESPEENIIVRQGLLVKRGHKPLQVRQESVLSQESTQTCSPDFREQPTAAGQSQQKDQMSGLSLKRLALDPEELMQNQSQVDSPSNGRPQASCFACFSFGSSKRNFAIAKKQ